MRVCSTVKEELYHLTPSTRLKRSSTERRIPPLIDTIYGSTSIYDDVGSRGFAKHAGEVEGRKPLMIL